MTKIDFYQIQDEEIAFACRLIGLIYRRGHQVYVHVKDQEQAESLDEHLWISPHDTFIPHTIQGTDLKVPIKIGHDHDPLDHQDVLINLSDIVPHFFSRFDRVAEVVPLDENRRQTARTNYSFYKERGYALKYHQLKRSLP